jgi:hypothetical protein
METVVAIVQSCYLPWKGYFDLVRHADVFMFYDSVQYTRRDWRNRNVIKTPQGHHWLTVPVKVKGKYDQLVNEVEVVDREWSSRHWQTIAMSYRHAKHFQDMAPSIQALLDSCGCLTKLSAINQQLTIGISQLLGITTTFVNSASYGSVAGRTENLVHLCRALGATTYLSGPSARDYLDESLFEAVNIGVRYMNYGGYPEYPQLHGAFAHQVSVIDLMMNTGQSAALYLDTTNR